MIGGKTALEMPKNAMKESAVKVAITCMVAVLITVAAVSPILLLPRPPLTSSASSSGSSLREILSGTGNYLDPSVSRDGSRIAFASNRTGSYQIWLIGLDGNHLTKLTDSPGVKTNPQWSADSKTIAFLSSSGSLSSIWAVKADGSGLTMVSREGESVKDFAWSPSGGRLAFDSYTNGKWSISIANIGSASVLLTNDTFSAMYPGWGPNGKELTYSSDRYGNFDVFVRDIASGMETRVTSSGDNLVPRFSPSGKQLLFMSNRTGSWSIWTQDVNGSALANLLDPYQEFRDPIWSPPVDISANPTWNPSGLSVLFISSNTVGVPDAYVLQPNVLVRADEVGTVALGVVQTRISANLTGSNSACWTPDGGGVVLSSNQGSDEGIWIVRFTPISPTNPYGQ